MNREMRARKEAFEALVKSLYALRTVRDMKSYLPLTDEEKQYITATHKKLDEITERLELLGIEKDFI